MSQHSTPVNPATLQDLLVTLDRDDLAARHLWGVVEALHALARHTTHPRRAEDLIGELCHHGRAQLGQGAILGVVGYEDTIGQAAAQQMTSALLLLAGKSLARALTWWQAGQVERARAALRSTVQAILAALAAVEGPDQAELLHDVAAHAYALGTLRGETLADIVATAVGHA